MLVFILNDKFLEIRDWVVNLLFANVEDDYSLRFFGVILGFVLQISVTIYILRVYLLDQEVNVHLMLLLISGCFINCL